MYTVQQLSVDCKQCTVWFNSIDTDVSVIIVQDYQQSQNTANNSNMFKSRQVVPIKRAIDAMITLDLAKLWLEKV